MAARTQASARSLNRRTVVFRLRLAGKISQRDQEVGFELQPPQRLHQAAFGRIVAKRRAANFVKDFGEAVFDRLIEKRIQHFGTAPGAIPQKGRKIKNGGEEIPDLALAGKQGRRPWQLGILGASGDFRQPIRRRGLVERRQ